MALNNQQWLICHKTQSKPQPIYSDVDIFTPTFICIITFDIYTQEQKILMSQK